VTLHDCTTTRSNALHGEPQHNRANSFGFIVVLPIDLRVSPASSKATLKKTRVSEDRRSYCALRRLTGHWALLRVNIELWGYVSAFRSTSPSLGLTVRKLKSTASATMPAVAADKVQPKCPWPVL
jgi:hypothetical protein